MSRRVLVTGGNGFIARDLIGRLAADGWTVRAATRHPGSITQNARIEPVAIGDLASPIDWRPLVDGCSHIIHLAGIAHATSAIPERVYMAVNADATQDLARAAAAASVTRIVMISSVRAQCGATADGIVNETRTPAPACSYGRSKLAGEHKLAEVLSNGPADWCVLRPVLVYGPGVKGNMGMLLRLAASPWPLPLGSLVARRSLLGLANLHAAVTQALASPAASRRTFLTADPGPLTVPEIVTAIRRGMGRTPGLFTVPLAPARLALAAMGRSSAWHRIAGDLVVSTTALEQSGWRSVETAEQGLARWLEHSGK